MIRLITLVNIIICFLAGFIYETRLSRFSPFPVNGLTTFYTAATIIISVCLRGVPRRQPHRRQA